MNRQSARDYIRSNFRDDDRLAVVLIQKPSGSVTQRISSADRIASDEFQAWLRYMNRQKHEVYISMNVLNADAHGRRKADVAEIRHVYLDFDKNGTEAVQALRSREDVPIPNHIIQSSPGKYQTIWRVEQFEPEQAENLMRGMVRGLGADLAATDSARVMRVPGFVNHKYGAPHWVTVENLADETYRPSHFPEFAADEHDHHHLAGMRPAKSATTGGGSQSERDWAYALRALRRGDELEDVTRAIEAFRSDKPNPRYYSELTVEKALSALNRSDALRLHQSAPEPDH